MKDIHIDILNEDWDCLDSMNTTLIPRVWDIISTIDRTHEQDPDNRNPWGTDIMKESEVKRVEIGYCHYGDTLNLSNTVPLVSVFV